MDSQTYISFDKCHVAACPQGGSNLTPTSCLSFSCEDFDETVTFIISCISVVVDLIIYSMSRYGSWLFEDDDEVIKSFSTNCVYSCERYLLENGNGTGDSSHDSDGVNVTSKIG